MGNVNISLRHKIFMQQLIYIYITIVKYSTPPNIYVTILYE